MLIPRGEIEGLISEEAFGIRKDHREIEVALFMRILCDRLRQLRNLGGLSSTNAYKYYDRVVHSDASLVAQSWVLPLSYTPSC